MRVFPHAWFGIAGPEQDTHSRLLGMAAFVTLLDAVRQALNGPGPELPSLARRRAKLKLLPG
jgi:hypothetical protein